MNPLFDKILAVLLFAAAIFIMVGVAFWFIPRDVIDIEMTPTQESFSIADGEIITENYVVSYGSAQSEYERILVCRNGVERAWYISTVRATSSKGEPRQSTGSFPIPSVAVPEHTCVIRIESSHQVQVLPFLSKTIYDEFESGEFSLTK